MTAYQQLESRFPRLYALRGAGGVLHWDMASMMPAGGGADRAEQLAAVNVTCHEILADPRLADLLDEAESGQATGLDAWQRANLIEMRRQWTHATALDSRLVEAMTKACAACEALWRKARAERSEEHPSELQSLMRISYAVLCLKKKKRRTPTHI